MWKTEPPFAVVPMSSFAVMQPYFLPYGGYFELVKAVDYFVFFDNAQFPRRGRVHRCRATDASGMTRWLTLPVVKTSRDTPISKMRLRSSPSAWFTHARSRYPDLLELTAGEALRDSIRRNWFKGLFSVVSETVAVVSSLRSPTPVFLTASDVLPRNNRSYQEYIRGIGVELGASSYINAAGGRHLYDPAFFASSGIQLAFMAPYSGSDENVLEAYDTRQRLSERIARTHDYVDPIVNIAKFSGGEAP